MKASSVCPRAQRVEVKSASSENGEEENHTVRASPQDVVEESAEAVRAVGLRLAGVDLVTPDIRPRLREAGGAIIEVNGTPGFQYHYEVADRASATRVALPVLETVLEEAARRPTGARSTDSSTGASAPPRPGPASAPVARRRGTGAATRRTSARGRSGWRSRSAAGASAERTYCASRHLARAPVFLEGAEVVERVPERDVLPVGAPDVRSLCRAGGIGEQRRRPGRRRDGGRSRR